jgi:hypothetical protein
VPGEFTDGYGATMANGEVIPLIYHSKFKLDQLNADKYGP